MNIMSYSHNKRWILRSASIIVLLGAWQIWASRPDVFLLAPPVSVAEQLYVQLFVSQDLLWAVVDVIQIAVAGYLVGSVLGVLLGLTTGLWEPAGNVISPILDGLYVVPVIALVPLIIIWFGLNSTAKIFLVILFCIFVVAFNTEEGVQETPQEMVDAARVFGAEGTQIYREVHFPHALPYVLTGLRLGMGRALRGMVVAELFIFSGDLGQYLINSGSSLEIGKLIAGITFLSILGVVVLQVTRVVEVRLLSYRESKG